MASSASSRTPSPRRLAAALLLLATTANLHGCASQEQRLLAARERAFDYFAQHVTVIETGWVVVFAYLYRRFGVTVTAADGRTVHDAREGVVPPEIFEVFRRLVDSSARVDILRIAELDSPIDRISASAIHCDRIPLPDDWIDVLTRAAHKGGYALTHSVAAAEWSVENGCYSPIQFADLHMEQVRLLVDLLEERQRLEQRSRVATDIWIEALVMLFYARAADRVRPEWIDTLLDLQREDGGWPAHPSAPGSDPHATALALWVILETLEPDAPRVAWIAGR